MYFCKNLILILKNYTLDKPYMPKQLSCFLFTSIIATNFAISSTVNNNNYGLDSIASNGIESLENISNEIFDITLQLQIDLKTNTFLDVEIIGRSIYRQKIDNLWIKKFINNLNFHKLIRDYRINKLSPKSLPLVDKCFKSYCKTNHSYQTYYKEYNLIEVAILIFLSKKKKKILQSLKRKYHLFKEINDIFTLRISSNYMVSFNCLESKNTCCYSSEDITISFIGFFYTYLIKIFIKEEIFSNLDFCNHSSELKKNKIFSSIKRCFNEIYELFKESDFLFIEGNLVVGRELTNELTCLELENKKLFFVYREDLIYSINEAMNLTSVNKPMPIRCEKCKKTYAGNNTEFFHYFELLKCGHNFCFECIEYRCSCFDMPKSIRKNQEYSLHRRRAICMTETLKINFKETTIFSLKFLPWEGGILPKYNNLNEELKKNIYILGGEQLQNILKDLGISFKNVQVKNIRNAALDFFLEKVSNEFCEYNEYKLRLDEFFALKIAKYIKTEFSPYYETPLFGEKDKSISFYHFRSKLLSALEKIYNTTNSYQDYTYETLYIVVPEEEYNRELRVFKGFRNIKVSIKFDGPCRLFTLNELETIRKKKCNSFLLEIGSYNRIMSIPGWGSKKYVILRFLPKNTSPYCYNKEFLIGAYYRENINKEIYIGLNELIDDFLGYMNENIIVDLNLSNSYENSQGVNGLIGMNICGELEFGSGIEYFKLSNWSSLYFFDQ